MPMLGGQQRYVDLMFNLAGAAVTTLTLMNAKVANLGTATQAGSDYSPKADGTLLGLEIQVTPQAATSLAQNGYITLTCTMWAPVNTLTIPFAGFGLQTAPQSIGGEQERQAWDDLSLPVKTSVPITGSVIYFWSPVTPQITVTGRFSAKFATAS